MRFLLSTMDGAGSLQPLLALVEALVARGHGVDALGHDAQRQPLERAGARVHRYATAAQLDQGDPASLKLAPAQRLAWLEAFQQLSRDDAMDLARRFEPDAMLVDCLMPGLLTGSKSAGLKTVALMHAPYSFWCDFMGGFCRAPMDGADLTLGFTSEAFDAGAAFPANLAFVGPVRPARGVDTAWRRRWSDRPLVLASLSTGVQGLPGSQVGLLQRICDALAGLDAESVVTTGRGIDPAEVKVGAFTTIALSVPHAAVLADADLFITHAGHGSVMAALAAGVPMLCLPPGADQPANAAQVAKLAVGDVLPVTASPAEIRAAALRLLADPALKARAEAFAARIAEEPGIDRAVELIEAI
ncbi:MAG TPA: nucleotide disphospho-sugar-binding domain-containing protein [Caulobacteraceae bacterium]|jgi:UDP:flavonoid glycosyltransferase YjiC (YdhE family)